MRQPFDGAVREHGPLVLRVCRVVVGPSDADDAWSETFLSALRAWPDLPDDADVAAWLVTIAHRRCIDLLRSRGRRAEPVGHGDDLDVHDHPGEGEGAGVSDATPDFWTGALPDDPVWAALRALPERQRLAVAHHHVAGFGHAETAALIGGSPAAARKASSDGIARLRRELTRPQDPRTDRKDTP